MRYFLGFGDAETAALAYDSCRRLFGAFAVCNYPDRAPESLALQVAERLKKRGLKLIDHPNQFRRLESRTMARPLGRARFDNARISPQKARHRGVVISGYE